MKEELICIALIIIGLLLVIVFYVWLCNTEQKRKKSEVEGIMIHFLDSLIESYHKGKDLHYHIKNRNLAFLIVMEINDFKKMKESAKSFMNSTSKKDLAKHCDYVLTLSCIENSDLCEISVCDNQYDFIYARKIVIS
jgi:hypothetical protein